MVAAEGESPRYIARVENVRELSLMGDADPEPWAPAMAQLGIAPAIRDGRALVMISFVSARWMGWRFREVVVAAHARVNTAGEAGEAFYLALAFQSSALFALIERRRFRTPYEHAQIRMELSAPTSASVRMSGRIVLAAAMGICARPSSEIDGSWEKPVYLPGVLNRPEPERSFFHARIGSRQMSCDFLPKEDSLEIRPPDADHPLSLLLLSGFRPQRWLLSDDARHARTATSSEPVASFPG